MWARNREVGVLYPLTFHPIFRERVWGGRSLARLYCKPLPFRIPIGESWEISDRPGDVSVVAGGPLAGKDLRWLMENHGAELLGAAQPQKGRFPLLIKILDAAEKLSLQVHPPPAKAAALGGEPKSEMWYIADAAPGAELHVGLRHGVTRADFERKIRDGTVADCLHCLAVRAGDAIFLPSGRVHAIGGGNVIFEVQQNSDTTYRVFDWNRPGLDGKPRELHVAQSLASINFTDFEPELIQSQPKDMRGGTVRPLVNDPLFAVEFVSMRSSQSVSWDVQACTMFGVAEGQVTVTAVGHSIELRAGGFCMVPACVKTVELRAKTPAAFLKITAR